MIEAADMTGNADYIQLSLFAHAVLRDLFAVEDQNGNLPSQPLEPLEEAKDSLINLTDNVVGSGSVFGTYEAMSVLFDVLDEEALPLHSPNELLDNIKNILDGSAMPVARLSKIRDTISVFSDLAHKALVRSVFPPNEIPKGVREIAEQYFAKM